MCLYEKKYVVCYLNTPLRVPAHTGDVCTCQPAEFFCRRRRCRHHTCNNIHTNVAGRCGLSMPLEWDGRKSLSPKIDSRIPSESNRFYQTFFILEKRAGFSANYIVYIYHH